MKPWNSAFRRVQYQDVLILAASAQTVSQREIEALEAKRARRLRELGDWRPSGGWQIEPRLTLGAT